MTLEHQRGNVSGSGTGAIAQGIRLEHLATDRNIGTVRVYSKGAVIWSRGEPMQSIFFVRRGRVCIVVNDEKGHESIVRMVEPGEPLGLSCFSARRRNAAPTTAVAHIRSELVEIPCDDFIAAARSSETALLGLLASLSEHICHVEERLRILINHDAEDRICALLEQMVARFGRPSRENPALHMLHLTHTELAAMAGMSRAHVSIIMGRLRSAGMVHYGRSKPLMVDLGALARRRSERHSGRVATARTSDTNDAPK